MRTINCINTDAHTLCEMQLLFPKIKPVSINFVKVDCL